MSEIDWRYDAKVDARGLACPLPVLKAGKALRRLAPGQRLLVEATDKMAAIDVPHFCNETAHRLIAVEESGEVLRFLIERVAKLGRVE
jgi:tRNA 2-thiouridine synthesizing protein A